MPARDELREAVGLQVGRRLDVHGRAEHEARDGNRPDVILERRLAAPRHARAGLGAEVLDDDFLDVAVRARAASRIASSASMRSARVSPMPIRMPVVNGTRARPAASSVASRTRRHLVGRAEVRAAALRQPLAAVSSMMPCDTDTLRRRASQASSITPGLRCGSRPVSLSTSARGRAPDSRACVAQPSARQRRRGPRRSAAPAGRPA